MTACGSQDSQDPSGIQSIDRLIHEPARLLILKKLAVVASADFVYLATQTQLTQGNLSSHMSRLEAVGYIEIKKEFIDRKPRTLYKLTETGKAAFVKYLEQMRGLLE